MMNSLPTLYKKTKTGATQVCDISYLDDYFYVTFGQLNGKMQVNPTLCSPKNTGRSNATTASQQAKLEAEAKWKQKVKSGYAESVEEPSSVQLPQKVKVYQDNIKNITFPCYSTPKLNGVNGTYWLLDDGSLQLTSRGGDDYPPIPHLEAEIKHLMELLDTTCLNGELYIHGEHLQDITSAVKKPKALSKQLEFAVFEAPLIATSYKTRRDNLITAMADDLLQDVTRLAGVECNSFEDIEDHYNQCMSGNLEGTVIYLPDAPYQFNTRSSYVFKYKKALDAEYKVVSYELDKKGNPTLVCEATSKTFKVRPKGTAEERKIILSNIDSYIGQWYKIEYETLSKDGVPLKPVGIGLRDCDIHGNPLV